MAHCGAQWDAGFLGLTGRAKRKSLALLHRQEKHLHASLPGCPSSLWQHPLHAVGLAGGGRATSALGAVGGASAQPPLAARELEHVERGRERGCWSSSTPSLPVQGELRHRQCSCVPVSGKRLGLFLEGLEGAELALVTQTVMRKAPVMLRLLTAPLQTTGTNFSPLCESATLCPVCLVY